MVKKVGIFSGTFDPIHEGHLEFAKQAIKKMSLTKVFFMVEPRPRRKQGVRSFKHRLNMARLAVENEAQMGLIILNQPRFTPHETLPILQARFSGAQLFMLMGEDMLDHLGEWPHVDSLIEGVGFMIGVRGKKTDIKKKILAIEKTRGLSFVYETFKTKYSEVSSSKIRLDIRRGHEPKGLDQEVLAYIRINGLYAPAEASS